MTPLLLVRDTDTFCDSLLATGVERFIAQTFHFQKGEFVAQTRKQAFDIMAEKLDCPVSQFQPRYVKHYREVFQTMKARLPQLGEGRQGFAPLRVVVIFFCHAACGLSGALRAGRKSPASGG